VRDGGGTVRVTDSVEFVLQAFDSDLSHVAARAEASGFAGIAVADHPGATWSPFIALASAAGNTDRLLLGTAVVNCGVREPLDIASDAATLQSLSGGRVVLGVGAGHTPAEWAQVGARRPSPSGRVDRFAEVVRSAAALLRGETVTLDGRYVTLRDARLQIQLPPPPPLLVGGGNPRLVRLGCELADYVELSGIGRTLPDGHLHEPRWSTRQVDAAVDVFERGCAATARRPVLGALVQHVELTDDAERAGRRYLDAAAAVIPLSYSRPSMICSSAPTVSSARPTNSS
jgi:alkanesulfonate monooxygenase SsuD/methylene tetrahydromethanopterin reductase-like flavin-dependent oxidoreductase (luciferase family)